MIKGPLKLFSPRYPTVIIYMLQSTEYKVLPYLSWYWQTNDFSKVMKRRTLDETRIAKLLRLALVTGIWLQIIAGIISISLYYFSDFRYGLGLGVLLLLLYPQIWAHLVVLPLLIGRVLVIWPRDKRYIAKSKKIFANHKAVKIAVAGSYGKTSMKELLSDVLKEGKNVAATPANKNTAPSHARFAARLTGDEEVLIIEFGEGKPGDVKGFTETVKPDIGVITGLAPAHLDRYKTLDAAARDIFYLSDYLKEKSLYVNKESKSAEKYIPKNTISYSSEGCNGWKVSNIKIKPDGLGFTAKKGRSSLNISSGLVGRHNIGPLCAVIAIASELGLNDKEIVKGIANTKPFEHRMQPRNLHGAWIVDDTYNGNIDGVKAGLSFLGEIEGKRRIYVTPGLVDQGKMNKQVHIEIGSEIKKSNPDIVVLMENSVTDYILEGIGDDFKGEIITQDDPLHFYTSLDKFVAAGDVVLMQNDWTDNYH